MEIFSSYYDNAPKLGKDPYTFVRVSRKEPPEWFVNDYPHVDLSESFGPTEAMLKECHPVENWSVFEPRYKEEILGALDKSKALETLEKIYCEHGNKPLVLLCYEKPPEDCHRHLIAEFLCRKIEEI